MTARCNACTRYMSQSQTLTKTRFQAVAIVQGIQQVI
jgi:hypothetical protein